MLIASNNTLKEVVMELEINQLLNMEKYNIYANEEINDSDMKIIISELAKENDLLKFFKLEKCKNKVCWKNCMEIIKGLEISQHEQIIPFLFECLQDPNWSIFEQAIIELKKTGREKIVKYVELYLKRAYKKEDYMWIGGIKCLVENIGIKQSDFINSDLFRLFECSDF